MRALIKLLVRLKKKKKEYTFTVRKLNSLHDNSIILHSLYYLNAMMIILGKTKTSFSGRLKTVWSGSNKRLIFFCYRPAAIYYYCTNLFSNGAITSVKHRLENQVFVSFICHINAQAKYKKQDYKRFLLFFN